MASFAVQGNQWSFEGDVINANGKTVALTPTILSEYARAGVLGWTIVKAGSLPYLTLHDAVLSADADLPYSTGCVESDLILPGPAVSRLLMKATADINVVFSVNIMLEEDATDVQRGFQVRFTLYGPDGVKYAEIYSPDDDTTPNENSQVRTRTETAVFTLRKGCLFFPYLTGEGFADGDVITVQKVDISCNPV